MAKQENNMPAQDYRIDEADSIQAYARAGGLLYLIIIVIGLIEQTVVLNKLVVFGDAAATAHRILQSELLWRANIAAHVVLLICAVALSSIWYVLFRPVNRNLALLSAFFGLISLSVESVGVLHLHAALAPLLNADYLTGLGTQQAQAASYLSVLSNADDFGLALIFFGMDCLIVGYLIRKSGYFPKFVGVLMQLAGLAYLINSFSRILSPSFADLLFPAILLPAFVGESTFCLWLLVKGVDLRMWKQAARSGH